VTWLEVLAGIGEWFNWLVHAYCLMSNHYHVLVETPDGNLARGMRQLNGVYTQRFNWEHRRVGHVYQGRYKAILVEKQTYLLELARHIVLNPVRARMVRDAEEWPCSSYRATAGLCSTPGWLTTEWTLAAFGRALGQAQAAYRHFVAEGRNQPSPWDQLKNQIYLGSEAFADRMLAPASESTKVLREIPVGQRRLIAQPLQYYFQTQPNGDKAIVEAFRTGNYTMKAIADHAGLHYSRVSRIVAATARDKS
jgi:putative transposase